MDASPVTLAARRRKELEDRIRELHQRNGQLAAALAEGRPSADGEHAISTLAKVRRAEELTRVAVQRAAQVARQAGAMHIRAAEAHDRAARMHELLADAGVADADAHRDKAAQHRQHAATDRATAGTLLRTSGD
jgi:hypothetical protein